MCAGLVGKLDQQPDDYAVNEKCALGHPIVDGIRFRMEHCCQLLEILLQGLITNGIWPRNSQYRLPPGLIRPVHGVSFNKIRTHAFVFHRLTIFSNRPLCALAQPFSCRVLQRPRRRAVYSLSASALLGAGQRRLKVRQQRSAVAPLAQLLLHRKRRVGNAFRKEYKLEKGRLGQRTMVALLRADSERLTCIELGRNTVGCCASIGFSSTLGFGGAMMKANLIVGFIIWTLGGPLMAQQVSVAGGSTECAHWLDSRRANDAAVLEHFVLGCLNGLSLGTGKEFWQANAISISREEVYAAIDSYCRTNPAGLIVAGSIRLFTERTRPPVNNFQ